MTRPGAGRRPPGTTVAVLAVVVALAVVGPAACGSGEIPLGEWLDRADEVCASAQAELDASPPAAGNLPGEPLRANADAIRAEAERLRELPAPIEKRTAVEDYLLSLDHHADVLDLYAEDLDATPADAPAPSVDDLAAITEEADTRALALGLTGCSAGVDLGLGPAPTVTAPQPTQPLGPDPTTGAEISEFDTQDQAG